MTTSWHRVSEHWLRRTAAAETRELEALKLAAMDDSGLPNKTQAVALLTAKGLMPYVENELRTSPKRYQGHWWVEVLR